MGYSNFDVILPFVLDLIRNQIKLTIVAALDFHLGHREATPADTKIGLNNPLGGIQSVCPCPTNIGACLSYILGAET